MVEDLFEDVGLGCASRLRGAQGFDEAPEGGRRLRGTRGDPQDLGGGLGCTLSGHIGRGRGCSALSRRSALTSSFARNRSLPRRFTRGGGIGGPSRGLVR